jgi:hypothetical protein
MLIMSLASISNAPNPENWSLPDTKRKKESPFVKTRIYLKSM